MRGVSKISTDGVNILGHSCFPETLVVFVSYIRFLGPRRSFLYSQTGVYSLMKVESCLRVYEVVLERTDLRGRKGRTLLWYRVRDVTGVFSLFVLQLGFNANKKGNRFGFSSFSDIGSV